MQVRRLIQIIAAATLVAVLSIQGSPANAGTCAFQTIISIACDSQTGCLGGGYVLHVGSGCTSGTVDLQQSTDGSSWSTVATNISNTYSYCPSAGDFYYRLKLNCSPCGQTTYGATEGPISCP